MQLCKRTGGSLCGRELAVCKLLRDLLLSLKVRSLMKSVQILKLNVTRKRL